MSASKLRFLIVGTARSGTTLVQRLCCELPDVWVPPETHFWALASEAADRFDFPLRGRNRIEMVAWMMDRVDPRTLPVRQSAIVDEIGKRDERAALWVVFESLVSAMSPPVEHLGEKTPGHVAHWEQLTAAVPDLKIIGLVRDPRAVLRSHRKVPWGDRDAWLLAERWVAHQRSLEDASRLLGPDRCMVMRYEELVASPEEHQASIASFLGVANDPTPLDPILLRDHPLFPERETWKAEALGEVTTDRTGDWDDDLTVNDVAIIDAVAGPNLDHHGYVATSDASPEPMSPASRSNVTAFRHWYAQMRATSGLPIT
jgi:hypothetical protein